MTGRLAISRWENEGGATHLTAPTKPTPGTTSLHAPPLKNAELVQLQVRVIALENLVIGLLAEGSARQRALARDMAVYISPRPGYTRHGLTIHAATQMNHMIGRAADWSLRPHAQEDGEDARS